MPWNRFSTRPSPSSSCTARQQALRSHVNDDPPAKHNYEVDNRQQNYRMLGDFFYPGDEKYDAREIPSDNEVKSEEALRVAMPEDNLDFNKLALSLCPSLPRDAALPTESAAASAWQQSRRARTARDRACEGLRSDCQRSRPRGERGRDRHVLEAADGQRVDGPGSRVGPRPAAADGDCRGGRRPPEYCGECG